MKEAKPLPVVSGGVTRKGFIMGVLGAAGTAVVVALLRGRLGWGDGAGDYWYEMVQDMYQRGKWHVNLYRGPVRGDLSRGELVEHSVEDGLDVEMVKREAEYHWRVQYSDGRREQSF
jgi:hypothetical protein